MLRAGILQFATTIFRALAVSGTEIDSSPFCNEAALAFTCTFADFFAIFHVHETVSVSLIVSIAIVQFDRLALPERFL